MTISLRKTETMLKMTNNKKILVLVLDNVCCIFFTFFIEPFFQEFQVI